MSSKRRLRRKTCQGKRAYDTLCEAWLAARRTYRDNRQRGDDIGKNGDVLRPYACGHCGHFHVGHYDPSKEQ